MVVGCGIWCLIGKPVNLFWRVTWSIMRNGMKWLHHVSLGTNTWGFSLSMVSTHSQTNQSIHTGNRHITRHGENRKIGSARVVSWKLRLQKRCPGHPDSALPANSAVLNLQSPQPQAGWQPAAREATDRSPEVGQKHGLHLGIIASPIDHEIQLH